MAITLEELDVKLEEACQRHQRNELYLRDDMRKQAKLMAAGLFCVAVSVLILCACRIFGGSS